jgi:hypothetical protein
MQVTDKKAFSSMPTGMQSSKERRSKRRATENPEERKKTLGPLASLNP